MDLQEAYGFPVEAGIEILGIPHKDLADLADITPDEVDKILSKLLEKDWITVEPNKPALILKNLKQLAHLAGHR